VLLEFDGHPFARTAYCSLKLCSGDPCPWDNCIGFDKEVATIGRKPNSVLGLVRGTNGGLQIGHCGCLDHPVFLAHGISRQNQELNPLQLELPTNLLPPDWM